MKKILFALITIISFSSAETIYNGYCVSNFYTKNSSSIFIEYSHGTTTITNYSDSKIESLVNNQGKFYYDSINNFCNAYIDSDYYGLTFNQFNFLMALTGIFSGFTFLFIACYLAILIGRK